MVAPSTNNQLSQLAAKEQYNPTTERLKPHQKNKRDF